MTNRIVLAMVDIAHRRDVEVHTLGSNAAQIVRHASCSVMVIR